ncbi:AfsR/SARP family transcriptional regulator [Nonomuraea basaltis]|uniref:AfsR/SARP family transcriptional regulator n=1 Tax=Nonomuraea basaltis TaxID=2495887 RepID=UPI001486F070|nr:BTAD domain-containing putative transcriptional regulator [Nonomuraea basaltis]
MGLDIRILGPWEASADGAPLPLAGSRRISLLARLALSAGQPVTAEQLLADVWGESRVATAAKQLHIVVSKLREALATHLAGEIIVTVPGGYRLDLPVEHVDAHRFARLVRDARAARARGDTAAAHALFRRSLGLWRGDALAEMQGDWARIEAARLEEERLSAFEDDTDLRLALGDHHAVVPELTAHVEVHPLRERPWAQLMLALYRASRPSEALAAYQDARRVMVEELGIEPGATLRRLQQAVLAADPVLDLPSPLQQAAPGVVPAPAELPALGVFTARHLELTWLGKALTETSPGAPTIVAIDGPGGIGKSALAVHAAHSVAHRFTDGVLYVDLRGATAGLEPLEPLDALGRLLRSLGLDGSAVPTVRDEAAARYRSLTAGRSLLIILDNALDARQVRPLLPAGADCVVIITSRQALTSLDGVNHLHLAELDPADSTTLLARMAGPAQVHAEPEAAARIVRLCGGLPLALHIAAARLAARPHWTLSYLADRLADATRRLDTLEHADLAVRVSLAASLHHLREEPTGQEATEMFALLGLLDTPEHTPAAAAALADRPAYAVEAVLDHLLAARLLEPAGPDRYRMHDLVRLYAREQAARDIPEPERRAATHRALHHYLATARTASLLLNPSQAIVADLHADLPGLRLNTPQEAIAWTEAERDNLIVAVRQADDLETVTGLAACVNVPFSHRGWLGDLIEIQRRALDIATRAGDWAGQARGHNYLGCIHKNRGSLESAVAHLEQAVLCWERAGTPSRAAGPLHNLGTTYGRLGRFDEALATQVKAIAATQESGLRDYEAIMLNGRASVLIRMGRLDEAIDAGRKSLEIWSDFDNPQGEGATCDTLADAYRRAGRYAEAETLYRRAVELQRAAGHRAVEAISLWGLGDTLNDLGRLAEARACWHRSARTLRDVHLLTEEELERILAQDVPPPPGPIKHF